MRSRHRAAAGPRSIALIGGALDDAVAAEPRIGYQGELWRVHPERESTPRRTYYRSVDELPGAPDAAFIAAPKARSPAVAAALRARGVGGFVCFASGFSETGTIAGQRADRRTASRAPATLPFFGPNCYGFVNFFDRRRRCGPTRWSASPKRGVALICQSGTIALTLMFNDRSLPIGYLFTVGNQTRLAVEDLIEMLWTRIGSAPLASTSKASRIPQRFARAASARARPASPSRWSRPDAPRRRRAPRRATPARWPAPTRSSMPSAARPASRAVTR